LPLRAKPDLLRICSVNVFHRLFRNGNPLPQCSLKSSQPGLTDSISAIFFVRLQPFNLLFTGNRCPDELKSLVVDQATAMVLSREAFDLIALVTR